MKKVFTSIVAVATVVVLSCSSVFAAGSSTGAVELANATDGNGNYVTTFTTETTVPLISAEIASEIAGESANAGAMTVVWQKDVSATSLPVTLNFNINGTEGQTLYVFHFNGTSWELITSGVGPAISATFTSLSPVAIVAKDTSAVPAAPEAAVDADAAPVAAPETGCFALAGALGALALSSSAAYVVSSKKEEEV